MQHDPRGGGEPWSHARRPSPVESGNRGNAELGACGVRGCTGVGVKKVARDVRFDVMAGRTRCLNVTRYNRARHTKGSFCSFPPRHTKRRRRSAGEGGRVARETHRGRPVTLSSSKQNLQRASLSPRPCNTLRVRHRVKRIHAWLHRLCPLPRTEARTTAATPAAVAVAVAASRRS